MKVSKYGNEHFKLDEGQTDIFILGVGNKRILPSSISDIPDLPVDLGDGNINLEKIYQIVKNNSSDLKRYFELYGLNIILEQMGIHYEDVSKKSVYNFLEQFLVLKNNKLVNYFSEVNSHLEFIKSFEHHAKREKANFFLQYKNYNELSLDDLLYSDSLTQEFCIRNSIIHNIQLACEENEVLKKVVENSFRNKSFEDTFDILKSYESFKQSEVDAIRKNNRGSSKSLFD